MPIHSLRKPSGMSVLSRVEENYGNYTFDKPNEKAHSSLNLLRENTMRFAN